MGPGGLLTLLLLTFCCEGASTTFLALYPLRHSLHQLLSFRGWKELYSISDSNLDVWLQSLFHCVLFCACAIWSLTSSHGRRIDQENGGKSPGLGTRVMATACQVNRSVL